MSDPESPTLRAYNNYQLVHTPPEKRNQPLPGEVEAGLNLHMAGLVCVYGDLRRTNGTDPDAALDEFLSDSEVKNKLIMCRRAGNPVFYGPSAMTEGTIVTIYTLNGSTSHGLWVPREGEIVDPDSIPAQRLV